MTREDAMHLVERRCTVRVRSGGFFGATEPPVMAEGEVIGYVDQPTIILRHADGTQSSWPITLPIEVVEQ